MKKLTSIILAIAMTLSLNIGANFLVNEPFDCGECDNCRDFGVCIIRAEIYTDEVGFWANYALTDEQLAAFVESGVILPSITYFEVRNSSLSDISPLANLPNLEIIDLHATQVSDISALAELTNLWEVSIGGNLIRDVSPLADLPNLRVVSFSYNYVDLECEEMLEAIDKIGATVAANESVGWTGFGYSPQYVEVDRENVEEPCEVCGVKKSRRVATYPRLNLDRRAAKRDSAGALLGECEESRSDLA